MKNVIREHGNWKVIKMNDKWGRPTDHLLARSKPHRPEMEIGEDYSLCLNVFRGTEEEGYVVFVQRPSGRLELRYDNEPDTRSAPKYHEVEVMHNGKEKKWKMLYDPGLLRLVIDRLSGEEVRGLYANMHSFGFILPTEKWGNLLYIFDVEGLESSISDMERFLWDKSKGLNI